MSGLRGCATRARSGWKRSAKAASGSRQNFRVTPVSAVVTLEDWKKEDHAGVWYLSRFGRLNLFRTEKRELTIRDWQLFDENCEEPRS